MLVCLIILHPSVSKADTLVELLDFFSKDFKVKFEETLNNEYLNYQASAEGTLYFRKGGLLRFEYIKPDPQLIIVGKNKVWIYDQTLNNVVIADLDNDDVVKSLVFFRQHSNLEQFFSVISKSKNKIIEPMANQKILYLKSVDPDHPLSEIHLA